MIAHDAGHDPIRATGLLFTHLVWICRQTTHDEAQVWELRARNRPAHNPWYHLERIAEHRNTDAETLWRQSRLSAAELARDPLALFES